MLSYPLVNTSISAFDTGHILSSSGYGFGGGSSVSNIADSVVGSIPVVGDLLGGTLNFLGIDFDCIKASFPPEKAKQETTAFIKSKLQEHNLNQLLASNASLKDIENTANDLLTIFSAGEHNRRLTGDGASGCTKDGEYLSSGMFKNAKNGILATLESSFDISIKDTVVNAKSGFRGAPVRPNPTKLITIHARKGSPIPKNDDSSNSGSNTDTDTTPPNNQGDNNNNDSYKPTKDLIGWIALIAGLFIGIPALIYSTLKKKK